MSVAKDFRDFIARGNVVDLAVGVIIGGAFGKIVTSLVNDIIMPPVGLLLSGVDFADLKIVIRAADPTHKIALVAIGYGAFINTVIQFLIVAAAIFAMVRALGALRRREAAAPPAAPPAPTPSEALLTEIRDLLAKNRADASS
jgi:large conductance mechanosensitive channel